MLFLYLRPMLLCFNYLVLNKKDNYWGPFPIQSLLSILYFTTSCRLLRNQYSKEGRGIWRSLTWPKKDNNKVKLCKYLWFVVEFEGINKFRFRPFVGINNNNRSVYLNDKSKFEKALIIKSIITFWDSIFFVKNYQIVRKQHITDKKSLGSTLLFWNDSCFVHYQILFKNETEVSSPVFYSNKHTSPNLYCKKCFWSMFMYYFYILTLSSPFPICFKQWKHKYWVF